MIIKVDDTISLELLDEKHAVATFALIDGNRKHLREWLPWVDQIKTIDNFQNYISKTKKQTEEGSDFGFIILFNNTVAGRIGIHYIDQQSKIGALGYWIGEDYSGKGIITKSCRAIINYGFNTLCLNRIEIKCGTENTKSRAIPEKLHFKLEGILRQAELINEHFIDLYVFSMLKEDWGKAE